MSTRLVWVDLETTGLDPENDLILECGIIVTEGPQFDEVTVQSWVIRYPERVLEARCNEWATKQHRASGLWSECATSLYYSGEIAKAIRDFLIAQDERPPMCGATIAFDRAFLRKHWPDVEGLFHYRSLDVSAFRTLLPVLGIDCPKKREAHRALDDLRDSIALARHVSDLLRAGDTPMGRSLP